jgi:hypothetical protein
VASIFAQIYFEPIFWALIGVLIVAVIVLLATFDWFPLEWRGFSGRAQRRQATSDLGVLARRGLLRHDLQQASQNLSAMNNPMPAELRAFAGNLARRLRNEGYDVSASRVEVLLPDNASPEEPCVRAAACRCTDLLAPSERPVLSRSLPGRRSCTAAWASVPE